MDRTCRFFAPDATVANEHGLIAGPTWPYAKLLNAPACCSPAMGAGETPITCEFTAGNQVSGCRCYEAEPQMIHAVYRMSRERPAHGETKFVIISLIEERMNLGVRILMLHRMETNDPTARTYVHEGVLESYASSRLGAETLPTAQATLRRLLAEPLASGETPWERVRALEVTVQRRPYYAHVLALAEREHDQRPGSPVLVSMGDDTP